MAISRETKGWKDSLTTRDDNPYEIHEEKIAPEVIGFWSAVCQVLVVVIEQAGRIIENIAVNLAKRDHCLDWIS